ncbi:MAG: NAD/NADP octopine/nopaline dehydrogenase family protein [Deltaproteobacteria bacterium]|nr:NAD/NADP octopine/nopaline dehydrogenase family protein [Deltaproteobacteria bacterium]
MRPKIAVYGNQHMNLGHAVAADLTLAGHEVTVFDLPEHGNTIAPLLDMGGIHVSGNPKALVSGKTGFAKPHRISTDPEEALRGVDLLFIDVPTDAFETRLEPIIPYIRDGAVLHFNYYGYWPSLRVAPLLRKAGKGGVMVTECPTCLYYARGKEGRLTFEVMKERVSLSVFPAVRTAEAFRVMRAAYPNFEPAQNVLATNFENLNLLWHPAIALLNAAHFDREKERGEKTAYFYQTGITEHTACLSEAQDRERESLCNAYGVPYHSLRDLTRQYVAGTGKTMTEVQRSSNFIQGSPAFDVDQWARWICWDMPLGVVPMVLLADLAGVPLPIHRGLVDIFGALLETDFWKTGLTLERLGLAGFSVREVLDYVTQG